MLACIFRLACLLLLSCMLITAVSSFNAVTFPKTSTSAKAISPIMSSSALSTAARHVGKLSPVTSCLLLCDIQERFSPLIYKTDTVVSTAQFLTSVGKALDIPVVATQQYTKAFGPTVPGCFADPADLEATPIFEKKLFSMLTPEVKDHLAKPDMKDRTSYILFGIEAHVCVQQTCLDLLEMGHDVHVIVDGVSSQQPIDREVALQRMAGAGAYLTTAQSAAFMLMKSAEHPNFKAVSKLVIEHMKKPNEFNEIARK